MRSSEYRSFLGWLDNPDSLQYWSQPHLQCGRVCHHRPAYTSCRNWESTDLLIPSDSPGLIGPMLTPPFKSLWVHSPRLVANSSYRRKPVSRKWYWIPPYPVRGRVSQARNDIPRTETDTPLLAAGLFIDGDA